MVYKSVEFTVEPYIPFGEVLISELAEIGFESFDDNAAPRLIGYCKSELFKEEKIKSLINHLQENSSVKISNIKINEHPDENWNAIWEASFEPIRVNHKVIIRAPFHPEEDLFNTQIIIQPKMSFGTGHHETTYQMIENMLTIPIENKEILDVGTGTGVLAILAHKLGAKKIVCTDIDDWSIENTKENFELNHINNYTLIKGDIDKISEQYFDVILANINKNVLKNHIPHYSALLKKDGNLLLSGFFYTDCNELTCIANKYHLTLTSKSEKNSWACLVLTKE